MRNGPLWPTIGNQMAWTDATIAVTVASRFIQANAVADAPASETITLKALVDFTDPKPELVAEGPIAPQLQSNREPQEVHFKDLVVETFPKEDKLITAQAP